ncbi:MAG TPA: ATP-binding protein, partial [Candidatus Lokiarchaeia archaeon]|nr:ATP-binding protein [Candidatus Lokiarchaeia archaeon]
DIDRDETRDVGRDETRDIGRDETRDIGRDETRDIGRDLDQYTTFQGTIESSDSPIFSVDSNYCYTSFNKSYATVMKSLNDADIELGKSMLDYLTVDVEREIAKNDFDRALQGEHLVVETYLGDEQPQRLYYEISQTPIMDTQGMIVGVAVNMRDVTEVKNARKKIEEMARLPLENPNPVLRVSMDGSILYANPGSEGILESWDYMDEGKVPQFVQSEINSAWTSKKTNKIEISAFDSVYSFDLVPIPEYKYVNMYGRDITDLKNTQQSLIRLNAELEARVEERTKSLEDAQERMQNTLNELAIAKDKAEESDKLKSAFLATMSHELRTPLNSIIGFTGILQQEMAGPLNMEQKKQLGMVRDSSTHLLNLINDVLDISKIEAGQMQIMIESFDLRASIAKIIHTIQPQAEKKDLSVEVDIEPGVGPIVSDQNRVDQIILNLLSNAIKFTEKGKVRIECSKIDDLVLIRVIDTGIGIKKEDVDKLFKPFRQIDNSITRRYEGTGLGLSICKKLVELLGGKIWVESEWGKGSTFSFALPVAR